MQGCRSESEQGHHKMSFFLLLLRVIIIARTRQLKYSIPPQHNRDDRPTILNRESERFDTVSVISFRTLVKELIGNRCECSKAQKN